jgi:hypothetical protein
MDVALGREVVDLVGPNRFDETVETPGVGHIPIVKKEPGRPRMARTRVLYVIDAAAIHAGRTANHAMNLIVFGE